MNKTTQELIEDLKLINQANGNFKKEEIDTFTFCFLIIGYLERVIQRTLYEALLDSQKPKVRYPELINLIMKEMTFGLKIKTFRFIMEKSKSWGDMKDFIHLCESINYGIRNNLFHFKLDELKYKGLDVSETSTQNKIISDIVSAEVKVKDYIEKTIGKKQLDITPTQKS